MAAPLSRLAAQAVHITTDPIPRSLTESKQVLAALQKFGEVVTFRNLWVYIPSTMLTVVSSWTLANIKGRIQTVRREELLSSTCPPHRRDFRNPRCGLSRNCGIAVDYPSPACESELEQNYNHKYTYVQSSLLHPGAIADPLPQLSHPEIPPQPRVRRKAQPLPQLLRSRP